MRPPRGLFCTRHLVSAASPRICSALSAYVRHPRVLLFPPSGTRVCFCSSPACRHPACSCLHFSAPRVLLLSHLEAGQNRADGKIDRLIYFIVGGLAVKGGLDFYSLKDAQREFGQKVAKELRQEASYAAKKS